MTGFVPEIVKLSAIDPEDALFRVSTERDDSGLYESIKRVGLVSPVVLQEKGQGGFRIVSGFRRVFICRKLGVQEIRALVAGQDAVFDDLAFLAASENASQRPLNIMEQARAVSLLGQGRTFAERAGIMKEAIGLAPNQRYLAQLESLLRLTPLIQNALVSGAVPFATALELGRLGENDAQALTRLFSALKTSLSKQREILESLNDITGRDGISIADILSLPEIADIWENEPDRGLATARLREKLRCMRFPHLTQAESRLRENLKSLKLPEGVSWEPPAFFEGEVHTLSLRVRSSADLEKFSGLVDSILKNPALSGIFS